MQESEPPETRVCKRCLESVIKDSWEALVQEIEPPYIKASLRALFRLR